MPLPNTTPGIAPAWEQFRQGYKKQVEEQPTMDTTELHIANNGRVIPPTPIKEVVDGEEFDLDEAPAAVEASTERVIVREVETPAPSAVKKEAKKRAVGAKVVPIDKAQPVKPVVEDKAALKAKIAAMQAALEEIEAPTPTPTKPVSKALAQSMAVLDEKREPTRPAGDTKVTLTLTWLRADNSRYTSTMDTWQSKEQELVMELTLIKKRKLTCDVLIKVEAGEYEPQPPRGYGRNTSYNRYATRY